MSTGKNIAIVGATGAVGQEILKVLEQRQFPVEHIVCLGSERSKGKLVNFSGKEYEVKLLADESFENIDIAFFAASGEVSKQYIPKAVSMGVICIDNSSAYRLDESVPLIVPEVNPSDVKLHKGIIANPNCSTIIATVPLWPLTQLSKIKRIIASTYQAASGAGIEGMNELLHSTEALLNKQDFEPKVFKENYAFNVFSHNSPINQDNGYNQEEEKLINETRKIFHDNEIKISVTCIRVPVMRAHCESIIVEFEEKVEVDEVRAVLSSAPGVKICDDREKELFPTPIKASNQDDILVGRIRKDLGDPTGKSIALFISGDQILKGAALNAVQIAELL
ncbi:MULTISPECIES: aspartate-semialdehyde dehydrogenase [Acinetobacter calcoaceticus/baumannii complex]|uniref:aspartate-semialdehyde dehydrogenase n=1 Tax=Acinetobacter calcoaceticus/baumannii complex TaxID=909768 RepID=UPI001580DE53|nr:aspartate-semialdehyde dehydrogenase [Acinetobacter lactucae]NUF39227.1 aspartate-semialdehyde dehydrogenase [Acinetobacter lactucae]